MDRIISDLYVKGEKRLWGDDPNTPFNQKIVAVNNMYGWLYDQGILEKVAFLFRDYSDMTYFAVDAKDLLPYRSQMESSGVEGTDVAIQHIFDEPYSPCIYSGSITLSKQMSTFRDFDGTVERSWESHLVQALDSPNALDVLAIKEKYGAKEAVRTVYDLIEFDPLEFVRSLVVDDYVQVAALDALSLNGVADMLESDQYAWGIFRDQELIGYCTLGGADDPDAGYDQEKEWNSNALVLSDVFIAPDYRGRGYAIYLVNEMLKKANPENEPVFLTVLDDRLTKLYAKMDFKLLSNGTMVKLSQVSKRSLKSQIQSASTRAAETQSFDNSSIKEPTPER